VDVLLQMEQLRISDTTVVLTVLTFVLRLCYRLIWDVEFGPVVQYH
jgi:hypothetical protein